MAKLADAPRLGRGTGNRIQVQVLLPAQVRALKLVKGNRGRRNLQAVSSTAEQASYTRWVAGAAPARPTRVKINVCN